MPLYLNIGKLKKDHLIKIYYFPKKSIALNP